MKRILFIFSFILACFLSCNFTYSREFPEAGKPLTSQQLYNLQALAKTYGYVRYFYPNPQTANYDEIKWYKLLAYAIENVWDKDSENELQQALQQLFSPIVPEIRFLSSSDRVPFPSSPQISGCYYWEHHGIGYIKLLDIYKSEIKFSPIHTPGIPTPDSLYTFNLSPSLMVALPLGLSRQVDKKSPELNTLEKEFSKIKFRLFNKPVWKILLGDKDKSWQLTTNPYFKCADLIVKWNIIQHFYPYYQEDYLAESWEERLIEAFRISCSSGMPAVHFEATNYLLAGVRDSHVQVERDAFVGGLAASYLRYSFPPLKLDWCDTGSIYLSDFPDTLNHTLKTGDILTAINGVPIDTLIQMKWEKTPASSFQGKMEVLTREKLIGTFRKDSILTMTLKNKEDELYDFSSKATIDYLDYIYTKWQKTEPSFISCYENQIYYINLHSSCSNYQEFKLQIPAMQNSKAILLDVRGYPDYSVADSIITHFSPDSLEWGTFGLPCYRFPDHCDVSYKINKDFLPAVSENNYINTPVYILINHKAMSYAETLIEVMKRNGVGTLTGQSTVGTNGNITHIQLPAFSFIMTAVKDFSGFHGEGIPPDIYISPSIESIRENRDYLVEEVIRLIQANEI